MKFNLEQYLKDHGVGYEKKETLYKNSPCTRYELKNCIFFDLIILLKTNKNGASPYSAEDKSIEDLILLL